MRRGVGRNRTRKLTGYFMRLIAILLVLIQAIFTWGCAAAPTTTEVKVPVAVACVHEVPDVPQTKSRAELLKLDRRRRTLTVWDERAQLKAYAEQAHAELLACKGGG